MDIRQVRDFALMLATIDDESFIRAQTDETRARLEKDARDLAAMADHLAEKVASVQADLDQECAERRLPNC